MGKVEHVLFF